MADIVEALRAEMHDALDALDAAKKAYEAGTGSLAALNLATEKTYEATDRYFDAMRGDVPERKSA
ncbi:MAG TPA: hypothetical protein VFA79_13060 [Myxococcales bacterium]|jgi:hypothetical protein|nr:hypothetical protein [Myxococcales bacterium]